ncbi:MAG: glycosyltransferase family 2 protein [Verrucomicrobia bacterium]|nr:glycosyltransferase family 2 protein [Verrucomicrobiota bacterium]MBU6446408.1 glycosyltransferase family 2 protein [Verrucomicrobiota bacterium]MDE3046991.1 glycosyltransferase family 2 protein [Verrucomicrobiota bacterium]
MEDFSLNLLCRGREHLLPITLDSLKAQSGSFEVILLDGEGSGKLNPLIKRYEGLNMRVEMGKGKSLPQLMNLGLSHSHGKYVQFLQPGELYLSQWGLSYLTELIAEEPPLIAARGVDEEIFSHWFLKSRLLAFGGFNEKVQNRPLFDVLCRFRKEGIEPLQSTRALIDGIQEPNGPLLETCQILYRHFGMAYAFKWMIHGHSRTWQRAATFLKDAFWRD